MEDSKKSYTIYYQEILMLIFSKEVHHISIRVIENYAEQQ